MAKDLKFEHGTGCGKIHRSTLMYGYMGTHLHAISVTYGAAAMWVWSLLATIFTAQLCRRARVVTWR